MLASLTARLLCVARQCYAIATDGPVADAPDSNQIGYLEAPQGFAAGDERIDAALVGRSGDGILLAFRGTLPPDSPNHGQAILDWLSDIDAILCVAPGFTGRVHQGFLGALNALWPAVEPALRALIGKFPKTPVYVTGHSKGGAVANLAAIRLKPLLGDTPIFVVTFAAARPGDAVFAAAYDKAIPHGVRYEYADDIVPHVPPSDAFLAMFRELPFLQQTLPTLTPGYVSVGDLHFIDWSGAVVGDSTLLRLERFKHLAELMVGFGFQTIVADHSIQPGSGYEKAIYQLPATSVA